MPSLRPDIDVLARCRHDRRPQGPSARPASARSPRADTSSRLLRSASAGGWCARGRVSSAMTNSAEGRSAGAGMHPKGRERSRGHRPPDSGTAARCGRNLTAPGMPRYRAHGVHHPACGRTACETAAVPGTERDRGDSPASGQQGPVRDVDETAARARSGPPGHPPRPAGRRGSRPPVGRKARIDR